MQFLMYSNSWRIAETSNGQWKVSFHGESHNTTCNSSIILQKCSPDSYEGPLGALWFSKKYRMSLKVLPSTLKIKYFKNPLGRFFYRILKFVLAYYAPLPKCFNTSSLPCGTSKDVNSCFCYTYLKITSNHVWSGTFHIQKKCNTYSTTQRRVFV